MGNATPDYSDVFPSLDNTPDKRVHSGEESFQRSGSLLSASQIYDLATKPMALARKLVLTWGWACAFYTNPICSRACGGETSGSTKNHLSSLLLFLAIKDPANSLFWWRTMSGFSLVVIQNHDVCDFMKDTHLGMAWSCLFWLFFLGFPLSSPSQSSPPPRLKIFFLTQPCL